MAFYMNQSKGVKRGDIFYIANSKFYSTDPSNEAGRPGIIVSNDTLNEHSTVVEVVYLTTKDKKPMPTHVGILCKIPSTALCETIYTVTKDRLGDFVRSCTDKEMAEINRGMLCSLGITAPVVERERLKLRRTLTLLRWRLRKISIRHCMNSFSTNLQRGDRQCKSFLRPVMVG